MYVRFTIFWPRLAFHFQKLFLIPKFDDIPIHSKYVHVRSLVIYLNAQYFSILVRLLCFLFSYIKRNICIVYAYYWQPIAICLMYIIKCKIIIKHLFKSNYSLDWNLHLRLSYSFIQYTLLYFIFSLKSISFGWF